MKNSIILCLFFSCYSFAEKVDVYFGTSGKKSDGIYHAQLNTANGVLTEPGQVADIGSVNFLAMHPNGDSIYAVNGGGKDPSIIGYHIKEAGALEEFTRIRIQDKPACHLSVHPTGKFIITAHYTGGSTWFFPLNEKGEISEGTLHKHDFASKIDPVRQNAPHPHWTGFSPDDHFAFVPDLGGDMVYIYKIANDFESMEKHGEAYTAEGAGPRHMRFSKNWKFIYLLNEFEMSVRVYEYEPIEGSMKYASDNPTLTADQIAQHDFNAASEILVHPSGKFVYAANRGHDSISVFEASEEGVLVRKQIEPIRGAWPRNINMDASGKWLLAAGQDSNTIAVFAIDQASGKLTHQRKSSRYVPSPSCILFP